MVARARLLVGAAVVGIFSCLLIFDPAVCPPLVLVPASCEICVSILDLLCDLLCDGEGIDVTRASSSCCLNRSSICRWLAASCSASFLASRSRRAFITSVGVRTALGGSANTGTGPVAALEPPFSARLFPPKPVG